MSRKFFKKLGLSALSVLTAASMLPVASLSAFGADSLEWKIGEDGKKYWYEDGVKMGVFGGAGNVWYDGTERGKEIYDPVSDGWYWLDAVYDGAKAEGKEVFMPYIYGNENELDPETKADLAYESNTAEENIEHAKLGYQIKMAMLNGTGKWVRYDENGKMLKGWVRIEGALEEKYPGQAGNVYYYDRRTGVMAKGIVEIDGKHYEFDRTFGTLIGETSEPTDEEAEATKTTDEEAEATKTTYYDWFMKSVEITTPEGIVTDKYEFEKDERGRTIKSVFYSTLCSLDKDGNTVYSSLYKTFESTSEYDPDPAYPDRLVKSVFVYYNDDPKDNYELYTTVTDYVNGREIKESTTYTKEDEQKNNQVTAYEYIEIDGSYYISKQIIRYPNDPDSDYSYEYSYDEKGNKTEEREYHSKTIRIKKTFTYNDKGNLLSDISYQYTDGKIEIPDSKYEYDYNDKNLRTQSRVYQYYNNVWTLRNKRDYIYDGNGNLAEELSYGGDKVDELYIKKIYKYTNINDKWQQTSEEQYEIIPDSDDGKLGFVYGRYKDLKGPWKDKDGTELLNVSGRYIYYDGSKHDYEKPDKPDEIEDIFVPDYPTDAVIGQQFSYIESQEYDGDLNPTSIMKIIDEYYEYTVEE